MDDLPIESESERRKVFRRSAPLVYGPLRPCADLGTEAHHDQTVAEILCSAPALPFATSPICYARIRGRSKH